VNGVAWHVFVWRSSVDRYHGVSIIALYTVLELKFLQVRVYSSFTWIFATFSNSNSNSNLNLECK
jgi:hypothetical protein